MENNGATPANMAGVYRHEESGKELTALTEPQADGLVRMGFKYVGEAEGKAAKQTEKIEEAKEGPEFEQPEGTGPIGATEKVQGDASTAQQQEKVPAKDDQTDLEKAKEGVPNVVGTDKPEDKKKANESEDKKGGK